MITLKNITFSYDENEFININELIFYEKEIVNIVGKNGSGKSTLGKILTQIEYSKTIQYFRDNLEINRDDLRITMVLQDPDYQFVKTTVIDDLAFGLENIGLNREKIGNMINSIAKELNIQDLLNLKINTLSGGQKQKVAIAASLLLNPDILILDEAFEMIDTKSTNEIIATLKKFAQKNEIIILNISHDPDVIKHFEKSYIITSRRKIFADYTKALFQNEELLSTYDINIPFEVELSKKMQIPMNKIMEYYETIHK